MPSEDCEGGALVSNGRRLTPGANVDVLVFLPLGTPHLVTPVTAGVRWVAKAAVFVAPDGPLVRQVEEQAASWRLVHRTPSVASDDLDPWRPGFRRRPSDEMVED